MPCRPVASGESAKKGLGFRTSQPLGTGPSCAGLRKLHACKMCNVFRLLQVDECMEIIMVLHDGVQTKSCSERKMNDGQPTRLRIYRDFSSGFDIIIDGLYCNGCGIRASGVQCIKITKEDP